MLLAKIKPQNATPFGVFVAKQPSIDRETIDFATVNVLEAKVSKIYKRQAA